MPRTLEQAQSGQHNVPPFRQNSTIPAEYKFRSPITQQFHSLVMGYINGNASINSITSFLANQADKSFMCEVSSNGFSHIQDVIHIGGDHGLDPSITMPLLGILLDHANYPSPTKFQETLTRQNNQGFTPLLAAVMLGNIEMAQLVMAKLQGCDPTGALLQTQLTTANKEGFTPLLAAVISGNVTMAQLVMDKLHALDPSGALLQTQLTTANKEGFTPLLDAVISGNVTMAQLVMDKLHALDPSGALLQTQLAKANTAGFTPLLQAVMSGNVTMEQLVIAKLQELDPSGALLQTQLAKANTAGFTPLLQAVKSGNVAVLASVIGAFKICKEKGVITTDILEQQFKVHKNGFNIFHDTVKCGASVSKCLVEGMRDLLGEKANTIISSLLNSPCQFRFTPLKVGKANRESLSYLQEVYNECLGVLPAVVSVPGANAAPVGEDRWQDRVVQCRQTDVNMHSRHVETHDGCDDRSIKQHRAEHGAHSGYAGEKSRRGDGRSRC